LVGAAEAVIKFSQKCSQFTSDVFDSFGVHTGSPYKHYAHKKLSAQAA
jgi:hypothetical protein